MPIRYERHGEMRSKKLLDEEIRRMQYLEEQRKRAMELAPPALPKMDTGTPFATHAPQPPAIDQIRQMASPQTAPSFRPFDINIGPVSTAKPALGPTQEKISRAGDIFFGGMLDEVGMGGKGVGFDGRKMFTDKPETTGEQAFQIAGRIVPYVAAGSVIGSFGIGSKVAGALSKFAPKLLANSLGPALERALIGGAVASTRQVMHKATSPEEFDVRDAVSDIGRTMGTFAAWSMASNMLGEPIRSGVAKMLPEAMNNKALPQALATLLSQVAGSAVVGPAMAGFQVFLNYMDNPDVVLTDQQTGEETAVPYREAGTMGQDFITQSMFFFGMDVAFGLLGIAQGKRKPVGSHRSKADVNKFADQLKNKGYNELAIKKTSKGWDYRWVKGGESLPKGHFKSGIFTNPKETNAYILGEVRSGAGKGNFVWYQHPKDQLGAALLEPVKGQVPHDYLFRYASMQPGHIPHVYRRTSPNLFRDPTPAETSKFKYGSEVEGKGFLVGSKYKIDLATRLHKTPIRGVHDLVNKFKEFSARVTGRVYSPPGRDPGGHQVSGAAFKRKELFPPQTAPGKTGVQRVGDVGQRIQRDPSQFGRAPQAQQELIPGTQKAGVVPQYGKQTPIQDYTVQPGHAPGHPGYPVLLEGRWDVENEVTGEVEYEPVAPEPVVDAHSGSPISRAIRRNQGFQSMYGATGSGHYGVGYVFGDDSSQSLTVERLIDSGDYNLYRPETPDQAELLHHFLKDVNLYAYNDKSDIMLGPILDNYDKLFPDLKEEELRSMLSDLGSYNTMVQSPTRWKPIFTEKGEADYTKDMDIYRLDLPSNLFMRMMGYDGVDIRGMESKYAPGSVIYNLDREPHYMTKEEYELAVKQALIEGSLPKKHQDDYRSANFRPQPLRRKDEAALKKILTSGKGTLPKRGELLKRHQEYIAVAVHDGKYVPHDVLKDYPAIMNTMEPWEMNFDTFESELARLEVAVAEANLRTGNTEDRIPDDPNDWRPYAMRVGFNEQEAYDYVRLNRLRAHPELPDLNTENPHSMWRQHIDMALEKKRTVPEHVLTERAWDRTEFAAEEGVIYGEPIGMDEEFTGRPVPDFLTGGQRIPEDVIREIARSFYGYGAQYKRAALLQQARHAKTRPLSNMIASIYDNILNMSQSPDIAKQLTEEILAELPARGVEAPDVDFDMLDEYLESMLKYKEGGDSPNVYHSKERFEDNVERAATGIAGAYQRFFGIPEGLSSARDGFRFSSDDQGDPRLVFSREIAHAYGVNVLFVDTHPNYRAIMGMYTPADNLIADTPIVAINRVSDARPGKLERTIGHEVIGHGAQHFYKTQPKDYFDSITTMLERYIRPGQIMHRGAIEDLSDIMGEMLTHQEYWDAMKDVMPPDTWERLSKIGTKYKMRTTLSKYKEQSKVMDAVIALMKDYYGHASKRPIFRAQLGRDYERLQGSRDYQQILELRDITTYQKEADPIEFQHSGERRWFPRLTVEQESQARELTKKVRAKIDDPQNSEALKDFAESENKIEHLVQYFKSAGGLDSDTMKALEKHLNTPLNKMDYDEVMRTLQATSMYINERIVDHIQEQRKSAKANRPKETSQAMKEFAFGSPEIEERFQRAHGLRKPGFWEQAGDMITEFYNIFSRSHKNLPNKGYYMPLRNDLINLAKHKNIASEKTVLRIKAMLGDIADDAGLYNLFERRVIMDDLLEDYRRHREMLNKEGTKESDNPYKWRNFDFTKETFVRDYKALDAAIKEYPEVTDALRMRSVLWESLVGQYVSAQEAIGHHVESKFTRANYYHRQVFDYMDLKEANISSRKLRTPRGRGWLKKRAEGGSGLDYNTNYLEAEFEVIAQMYNDIRRADAIANVNRRYNYYDAFVAKASEMNAGKPKEEHVTWQELARGKTSPEGNPLVEWYPTEGNIFFFADTIPSNIAIKLYTEQLKSVGVKKEDLGRVMAIGEKHKPFLVDENVALTLDDLNSTESSRFWGAVGETAMNLLRFWKKYQLVSPGRLVKYNLRNFSSDVEFPLALNQGTFKYFPRAMKELYEHMFAGGTSIQDIEKASFHNDDHIWAWIERGGLQSNLQAQEMGELNHLKDFAKITKGYDSWKDVPAKVWNEYWMTARLATDYRESLLRYASFIDYTDQMKKNIDPQYIDEKGNIHKDHVNEASPNNFGASIPEEIMALDNIYNRAYWLSNELLGAYDRISEGGSWLRKYLLPFWSWKEVNMKRFTRIMQNTQNDGTIAEQVGRHFLNKLRRAAGRGTVNNNTLIPRESRSLLAKSPLIAMRVGSVLLRLGALWGTTQLYNNLRFPGHQHSIPERDRRGFYLITSRTSDGGYIYYNRLGFMNDLFEWIGGSPWDIANDVIKGRKTLLDAAKDMAMAPWKVLIGAVGPHVTLPFELVTGQSLFPDPTSPSSIRNSLYHIAQGLGLTGIYSRLAGTPRRTYGEELQRLLAYKQNENQGAYYDIRNEVRYFRRSEGDSLGGGGDPTDRSNALYYMRLAIHYRDREAFEKYMIEYVTHGGTIQGFETSMRNLHPLYGISEDRQRRFVNDWLDDDGKEKLKRAIDYYNNTIVGGGEFRFGVTRNK